MSLVDRNHNSVKDPAAYETWYHTPRGAWVGDVEFQLMMQLLQPASGAMLLDVGSGTGYFSRRFAAAGLQVTGVDPDRSMTDYARRLDSAVTYIEGTAIDLPFSDRSFDHVTAVTSLCFIDDPRRALAEMWRVCRHAVVLGLLNRHSLLFRQKYGQGSYRGARWDTVSAARSWWKDMHPAPQVATRSAVFCSSGSALAQGAEKLLPNTLPWGGFLAVVLYKPP
jgi:SAM-dependent methyltransferase